MFKLLLFEVQQILQNGDNDIEPLFINTCSL